MYSAVSGKEMKDAVEEFAGTDMLQFKLALTEALVEHLNPIREKYLQYLTLADIFLS